MISKLKVFVYLTLLSNFLLIMDQVAPIAFYTIKIAFLSAEQISGEKMLFAICILSLVFLFAHKFLYRKGTRK